MVIPPLQICANLTLVATEAETSRQKGFLKMSRYQIIDEILICHAVELSDSPNPYLAINNSQFTVKKWQY